MKEIKMIHGHVALVDDADFEWLSQFHWYPQIMANSKDLVYAANMQHLGYLSGKRKQKLTRMHRLIMGNPKGKVIDHVDDNGLNNQRSNLRICTHGQNMANSRTVSTTGYKGVTEKTDHFRVNPFQSHIWTNGASLCIGSCSTPEDAARLYDVKAIEVHGEFARLNFPRENYL